ncbi:sugar O-acetyltransferase [Turicibacter sanguinis]|uniref:sugar O-acetyltransferase n=1 Tax=Turicibacter sanguinis TaxID=154288 RepID=UPI002B4B98BF|nr:sugar O-acetyltransferase [Turicibacter sanguinis]
MAAGQLFTDNCDGLAEDRQNAKRRMKAFNETGPDEIQTRIQLMNEMFGKETKAWIEPPFYFCYGYNIEIGEKSYVNFNCQFMDDGKITIGKKVMFGPGVTIATVGHPINPNYREYMYTDAVIIEDNCWIGEGVVICPGVIIGENTVIRAGSVVTKSIPANCVAVGNPCRVLREINEQDLKYYYKNREITVKDLEEEAVCRLKG